MIIFMIEEDPGDVAIMLKRLSELDHSYDVVIITNGNNAVNMLKSIEKHPDVHRPDLIILNLKSPSIDGLGLLGLIKKGKRLKDSTVAVLSENLDLAPREEVLKMGADEFFCKPQDRTDYPGIVSEIYDLAVNKMKSQVK